MSRNRAAGYTDRVYRSFVRAWNTYESILEAMLKLHNLTDEKGVDNYEAEKFAIYQWLLGMYADTDSYNDERLKKVCNHICAVVNTLDMPLEEIFAELTPAIFDEMTGYMTEKINDSRK